MVLYSIAEHQKSQDLRHNFTFKKYMEVSTKALCILYIGGVVGTAPYKV